MQNKKCGDYEHTSGGFVSHAKHCEAIGTLDVKDKAVMGIGSVAVVDINSVLLHYLLQHLPGNGVGVCRRGTELRQHHLSPRHHPIQYPHLRRDRDSETFAVQVELRLGE